jgi:hypothetical protein
LYSSAEVDDCSRLVNGQVGKRNAWTLTPRGQQVVASSSVASARGVDTREAERVVDEIMSRPTPGAASEVRTRTTRRAAADMPSRRS